jgi:hypothetical protein
MSEPFSVGNFLDATVGVALIYEYDHIIREMIWLLYPTFEMDLCADDSPYATYCRCTSRIVCMGLEIAVISRADTSAGT